MIFIVVKHPIKPEYADQWPALVEDFTRATRAEPGNISFEWSRSLDDPSVWIVVEAFRDGEAGQAHVNSDHFKAWVARMPGYLAAVPDIVYADLPAQEGWSRMAEVQLPEA